MFVGHDGKQLMINIAVCRRSNRVAGQTLVEFALVLPVFVLVLFGVIDGGRLIYTNAALSQAAREGARLAATEAAYIGLSGPGCVATPSDIGPSNPGAHVCPPDVASFTADITDAVNRMVVGLGRVDTVFISCNAGAASGDPPPAGDWTDTSGGNGCAESGAPNTSHGDLISVRLEYTFQPITPIAGSLVGAVPLGASTTMVIN